jgi:hypothetical protein
MNRNLLVRHSEGNKCNNRSYADFLMHEVEMKIKFRFNIKKTADHSYVGIATTKRAKDQRSQNL